jgi:cytochrome P450
MLDADEKLGSWPFARDNPALPPAEYATRRERCPVSKVRTWDGSAAWLFTRYADIRKALRDQRLSSDSSVDHFPAPNETIAMARKVQRGFTRLDGEAHSRQRNLLAKYFTISHVSSMREIVETKVEDLLNEMEGKGGPLDLVQHLSLPLPIFLTCVLLNLPTEDGPYLLDRVMAWMSSDSTPEESAKGADDIIVYFAQVIEREKANPSEGMVAELVHEHVAKGHISEDELLWMLHLLLVGGFDTAANMISLGTLTLLNHPEEIERLLADPSRVSLVVEELLRMHSVAHYTAGRMALDDLEIGEAKICKGQGVLAPLPAANFDPEAFPDPEKFCPDRNARAHLAFGFGIHQCLGQPVARLELSIVFDQLFKRFPTLKVAVPESELTYTNAMIYGLESLPVIW